MNDRQRQILMQIIEKFVDTAAPVGSKSLDFEVSSATIRNDMSALEEKGYLKKPHISGGRVPTARAYRLFVNDFLHEQVMLMRTVDAKLADSDKTPAEQLIERAVFELAEESKLLAFAVLPSGQTFYLGLSRLLLQPEFSEPIKTSEIIDLIEHRDKFTALLDSIDIDHTLKVYIGAENILPVLEATSLLVTRYEIGGAGGAIGLLGPVRMNYPQALTALKKTLEKYNLAKQVIKLPAARGYFLE